MEKNHTIDAILVEVRMYAGKHGIKIRISRGWFFLATWKKRRRMRLDEVFDAYYDRVYGFALFRLRNHHDAEDIASEVFFRAAKGWRRFDETRATVSTWLFTIAVNEIKRHCRKKRDSLPLESAESLASGENTLGAVLVNERSRGLYDAMAKLDERQRSVLLLRYYGDLTDREIARALDLTETNVETILYRAKKSLKNILEKCELSQAAGYKQMNDAGNEAEHE